MNVRYVAIVLLLILAATEAPAQRGGLLGPVPLSVEETVTLAVANNRDIQAQNINRDIAEFNLVSARGVFDPRISLRSFGEREIIPIGSIIGGGPEGQVTDRRITFDPRVLGFSPWLGGEYDIGFESFRLNTSNLFATLSPQYSTSLIFFYRQPLLQGLTIDVNRQRIAVARRTVKLTDEKFREIVMDTVTEAVRRYWELVFAVSNVQIQTEAVRLAREQLETNRRAAAAGLLPQISVVEAEAQVATFEVDLYKARDIRERAQNDLKMMILADRSSPLWASALEPTSAPGLPHLDLNLDTALGEALANRPERNQMAITAQINKVNTQLFQNLKLPRLHLETRYTLAGLAGTVTGRQALTAGSAFQEDVPPILRGGLRQSLSTLFNRNFSTLQVGVTFLLPIFNRTAEADLSAALAEGRRIRVETQRVEMEIEAEVRTAIEAVANGRERLRAAVAAETAAREQFESEQRRFVSGLSTVFLVLERQKQLTIARSRANRARSDYGNAVADFYRATGQTLREHNIDVVR